MSDASQDLQAKPTCRIFEMSDADAAARGPRRSASKVAVANGAWSAF